MCVHTQWLVHTNNWRHYCPPSFLSLSQKVRLTLGLWTRGSIIIPIISSICKNDQINHSVQSYQKLTLISSAALTGQKEDHSMETIFPWVGRDRFTTSGYESKHTAKTSKTFQRDGKFLTYLSPTGHLYRRNKEFLCSWFLDFRNHELPNKQEQEQTRTYIENYVFPFLVSENRVLVYKNGFNSEPWVQYVCSP